jgi:hypothetical protein
MTTSETETETAVKYRPILFSGEMIRAILDGRKSMTRRVVKPQPDNIRSSPFVKSGIEDVHGYEVKCPYFVGQQLWVRETHAFERIVESGEDFYNSYSKVIYRATEPELPANVETGWKPPIFMPRWASRITLEVTGVRVERVQDITHEDAVAEGFTQSWDPVEYPHGKAWGRLGFSNTWDKLNEKRGYGWDTSPWVWVISFKVVQP